MLSETNGRIVCCFVAAPDSFVISLSQVNPHMPRVSSVVRLVTCPGPAQTTPKDYTAGAVVTHTLKVLNYANTSNRQSITLSLLLICRRMLSCVWFSRTHPEGLSVLVTYSTYNIFLSEYPSLVSSIQYISICMAFLSVLFNLFLSESSVQFLSLMHSKMLLD